MNGTLSDLLLLGVLLDYLVIKYAQRGEQMESTEYKVLVNKYNEVVEQHNKLVNKHNALCDDYTELINKHNKLSEYVDTMATVVALLLVDYIEKIPDEKAKDLATKFKGILASRLEKVSHAE